MRGIGTQYSDHPFCTHIRIQYADSTCVHSQCSSCVRIYVQTYVIMTAFFALARTLCTQGCLSQSSLAMYPSSHTLNAASCCTAAITHASHVPASPPHTHALSMQRLLLQFVLPALTAEFVDRRMIPFVLPSILLIAEGLNSDEYLTHVLPSLLPVFQMEEPVQVSTL